MGCFCWGAARCSAVVLLEPSTVPMGLRCVFQSRFWSCLQCIAADMWLGWQRPTWLSRCGAHAHQSLGLGSAASLEAFPEFNTWGNIGSQCGSKSGSGLVLLCVGVIVRWEVSTHWGCVCVCGGGGEAAGLQVLAPIHSVPPRVCGRACSIVTRDAEGSGRKSAAGPGRGQAQMSQGQSPS